MKRLFVAVFAVLGLVALVALGAGYTLLRIGTVTPDKVANYLKFSPVASGLGKVKSETTYITNFVRLTAVSYALPVMDSGFPNGGGAIAEVPGGILVADRNGSFHFFDMRGKEPVLRTTAIAIAVNEAGYEKFASAQGYDVRPGTNVGFAGLGMRLHDLLLLRDGKHLLASYTYWDDAQNCATQRVAQTEISFGGAVPTAMAWTEIFKSQPCLGLSGYKKKPFAGHQAGGRMVEMADGRILLTTGDFKNDGVKRDVSVADLANDYGKIHILDLAQHTARHYSVGHRNPQGLTIADDGTIWETEHGPTGGDEINIIHDGGDYGWPKVTLGIDCHGCDWQVEGRHDGFAPPVFAFMPSIGVSNVIQLHDFHPNWNGDLLVASMVGQTLHHLRIADHRVVYDETVAMSDRLRDLIQLADHRVVAWTDSGRLIFLTPALDKSPSENLADTYSQNLRDLMVQCRQCHDFDRGVERQGKLSLWGVVGRGRGSLPSPLYSDGMRALGGTWTPDLLDPYLANPQAVVPGTTMAFEGVTDPDLRKEIIDYLGKLR